MSDEDFPWEHSLPDARESKKAKETICENLPFDIRGVNLTKPPGFVGEVAEWIEAQSFRPRKHIAVAGALTAMGNIAGLRFIDDLSGVTTNLFTFCVAGARTGKESIQQAVIALHKAAGLSAATHGGIKSEQEVTRNLIRHQSALYVVDEFGILLKKLRDSQKTGGSPYLQGVIGILMSAYSKADAWLLLTGDAKEEVRGALIKELSGLVKMQEDKPSKHGEERIEAIERALNNLDNGLEKPFLSLMGCTTPITFEGLVDHETATNGFIGRSLIFNERETVPLVKPNFSKMPMTMQMEMRVSHIHSGGEFDTNSNHRVENYRNRLVVPTDLEAAAMLAAVSTWMEEQAEAQKHTGLESLYLGGYELVSKVSLILAVPDNLRTQEHVKWAFTLIKRDIQEKVSLVVGNDTHKEFQGDALHARIMNLVSGEAGEKEGVILNRVARGGFRREDVISALVDMSEAGLIDLSETIHPRNKSVVRRYLKASEA